VEEGPDRRQGKESGPDIRSHQAGVRQNIGIEDNQRQGKQRRRGTEPLVRRKKTTSESATASSAAAILMRKTSLWLPPSLWASHSWPPV